MTSSSFEWMNVNKYRHRFAMATIISWTSIHFSCFYFYICSFICVDNIIFFSKIIIDSSEFQSSIHKNHEIFAWGKFINVGLWSLLMTNTIWIWNTYENQRIQKKQSKTFVILTFLFMVCFSTILLYTLCINKFPFFLFVICIDDLRNSQSYHNKKQNSI